MADFPKQLLVSPSGFPDLPPGQAIALNRMVDVIRKHYERAGFVPIETPLVERTEVLTAKAEGEIRTQMYGLRLLNPSEGEDDTKELALRFDQTVPLARFVAAQQRALSFPFRRYVIGPVFRGERPRDGRYRQFIQADIDVIGDGTLSTFHDAEMVSVIHGLFSELSIGSFVVRINNRKILQGALSFAGIGSKKAASEALGAIDRLEKVGREAVMESLQKLNIEKKAAEELLAFLTMKGTTDEMLSALKAKTFAEPYQEGVTELEQVVQAVRMLGVPEDCFCVDLSIARGLDYYTGTVYETRLNAHEDLGSIASGGRYENLAEAFTSKKLPGVGISIGVTRLLLRLIKQNLMAADTLTVAPVLVTTAAGVEEGNGAYFSYAARLREANIPTELYLEAKPLDKQLQFADRRGFTLAIIANKEQLEQGTVIVKQLKTRTQQEVSSEDLVTTVQNLLSSAT